jgi:site-specific DNA-methyltransferase (adenine-specific)
MFELNRLYNADCMAAMREIPDNFFELAIVDPPYGNAIRPDGAGISGGAVDQWQGRGGTRFGGRFDKYAVPAERTGGTLAAEYGKKIANWDIAPPPEYFAELSRVSRNQIIWGGNYFALPPTRGFVVWDKQNISETFSMAMCEYAWTSFNVNAKIIKAIPQGLPGEKRFHPTQKPVKLYGKLLDMFAKAGDKILDTHAGSASCLVACRRAGLEFCGFEINVDYFAMAQERLEEESAQVTLFDVF